MKLPRKALAHVGERTLPGLTPFRHELTVLRPALEWCLEEKDLGSSSSVDVTVRRAPDFAPLIGSLLLSKRCESLC